jgi:hypothetical protein
VLRARKAQILREFFLQAVLHDAFDCGGDGAVNLLAHRTFAIAWKPMTVDKLQVVIQVASIVKLLGMAHRGILSLETGA